VVAYLPIFLFVILFGLSMDYHVFILSRIREAHDRGMSTDDAVAYGIKSTASVVTSAALVMVGVFSIFGTLSFLFLKEFGVGLAAAVLIDATLVRAVLLPAAMKLLAKRTGTCRAGSSGSRDSAARNRLQPRSRTPRLPTRQLHEDGNASSPRARRGEEIRLAGLCS